MFWEPAKSGVPAYARSESGPRLMVPTPVAVTGTAKSTVDWRPVPTPAKP